VREGIRTTKDAKDAKISIVFFVLFACFVVQTTIAPSITAQTFRGSVTTV